MRREGLENLVTTGMLEGKRSRGKQREKLIEGLTDWLKAGKSLEAIEATKDRKKWRTMIANALRNLNWKSSQRGSPLHVVRGLSRLVTLSLLKCNYLETTLNTLMICDPFHPLEGGFCVKKDLELHLVDTLYCSCEKISKDVYRVKLVYQIVTNSRVKLGLRWESQSGKLSRSRTKFFDLPEILDIPKASYSCSPEMIQGYFNGKSASCTCSLTSNNYPKGQAQWYRGSQIVPEVSGGVLDLSFDSSNPEQNYTCKSVSAVGESSGSTLTAKFAFFEQDAVMLSSANNNTTFDLCADKNQIPVTCAVLKDNICPAPIVRFSQTNLPFNNLQERQDGSYYQSQVDLNPDVGGMYQVTCRVTNTIISETKRKELSLTFRKPPPLSPKITIQGETYQGVNALNRITLAAGYTGDMTCRVEGGYPKAHTTQLTCGSLSASGGENAVTLTFQAGQLNKDMDGTECKCTSQHVTGCYYNNETNLTLDVTSSPVFYEGDTPTFNCTAQGNPPLNLTITRKRTKKQLASVRRNLKADMTHTMEPLGCLDTDLYVCTGQNNQGVTSKEIGAVVKCPQQLASKISWPEAVQVATSETAELGLEIYGYPTPHLLTLMRTRDNTNLTGSARHLIEYSPGQAPFGFVKVTIFFVEEEDFTNYTITVDNGVGDPLVYPFYLAEVKVTVKQEEEGGSEDVFIAVSVNVAVVAVVVIAVVVIAVVLVILVLRYRASRKSPLFQPSQEGELLGPADEFEMRVTQSMREGMRPASRESPLLQPTQENGYLDILPESVDGYEVPVTQSMREGMRRESGNRVQVNAYEQNNPEPVNEYEMPNGMVQEEGEESNTVPKKRDRL
ncbi:hemicentin-2 [Plakobranchus ocellatus]|uniref:Hemicentin-2 n=1 Tax=Plakobranchus ocellatus TaxID=259542 RepID=A0AAV4DQM4_9GAST|nr:hemicentin-2 [Plakobranchus ocellatus]